MQEGKVYRLRDHMETEEWTDYHGWLWVFQRYAPSGTGAITYAVARSVATGALAKFFPNAFEEVSDAGG